MSELYGRSGDPTVWSRTYHVVIDPDSTQVEQDIIDWVEANTPAELVGDEANYRRSSANFDEIPGLVNQFTVEVEWTQRGQTPVEAPQAPIQEPDTVEFSFSFSAEGKQITETLETKYGVNQEGGNVIGLFRGAINVVQKEEGGLDIEGVDGQPAPETFTLAYVVRNALITNQYLLDVAKLCGKVNSDVFRGFYQPGELQFVRCNGTRRDQENWRLEFGFAFRENQTNKQVGPNFTIPQLDGHDIYWLYYKTKPDVQNRALVKDAEMIFVERIYERDNFTTTLNLPN